MNSILDNLEGGEVLNPDAGPEQATGERVDFHTEIKNTMIRALEEDRSFLTTAIEAGEPSHPFYPAKNAPVAGTNVLILAQAKIDGNFENSDWATLKQVANFQKADGSLIGVDKGTKAAARVQSWLPVREVESDRTTGRIVPKRDENGQFIPFKDDKGMGRNRPFFSNVFNTAQFNGPIMSTTPQKTDKVRQEATRLAIESIMEKHPPSVERNIALFSLATKNGAQYTPENTPEIRTQLAQEVRDGHVFIMTRNAQETAGSIQKNIDQKIDAYMDRLMEGGRPRAESMKTDVDYGEVRLETVATLDASRQARAAGQAVPNRSPGE